MIHLALGTRDVLLWDGDSTSKISPEGFLWSLYGRGKEAYPPSVNRDCD